MEEEKSRNKAPTLCQRRIWKFYEWGVVLAPILLMLSHWYIFYVFSQNNKELLQYSSANEICIVWIYTILYLYVPLMLLPASYFFKWCNLFRVPFVYFVFINVERWYYGSWFCTNEMIDTHYILIYCIICIYIMEVVGILLDHSKSLPRYLRILTLRGVNKIREVAANRKKRRENYQKVMKVLDKDNHDED